PRFVLNPVKIFEGSFGGEALWENPDYVSPARYRQMMRKQASTRYENRVGQKLSREAKRSDATYPTDETNEVYCLNPTKKATKIAAQEQESSDSSDEDEDDEVNGKDSDEVENDESSDQEDSEDIKTLVPHHREESKMERTKTLRVINEMCTMKHCNKAILFEGRRKMDLYMWMANVPEGPSVKFFVENVHTMGELKMTGNCLRGSRPLLSFDPSFSQLPHLKLLRELLMQIFGVPNYHPKSQPFIDHVYTFAYLDKRIWFRNFQILSEDGV
uniref:Ribosome biogenesis protein BRX1 homolog n=1 Tax=Phlebotomus papatasi TaxID=29031 RepID=A0A1B0DL96_PHLPP